MKQELESALFSDFPLLYRGERYFECDDGWEPLIRRLSEKLEPLIQKQIEDGVSLEDVAKCAQCKEKFGSMRYYLYGATDKMYELSHTAEEESVKTCEVCGEPGKIGGRSWLRCLCPEHRADDDYSRAQK